MRVVPLSPHLRSLVGLLLAAALGAACAAPAPTALPTPPPQFNLTIATVPAGREHLSTWLALYRNEHSNFETGILVLDAARAQEALAQGKIDLALIDQPPAPAYRGILTATEVAREPLAFIVHPANPLRDVPAVVAADLLSGRVMGWDQVGGADLPVQVYLLPDSTGEMVALTQIFPGRRLASQAVVCATHDSLRAAVAADPGGIGILPYRFAVGQIAVLRVDGMAPNDPAYPWQVPLFLAHGPAGAERSPAFVRFVLGIERGK